jgi:hypothetical protein
MKRFILPVVLAGLLSSVVMGDDAPLLFFNTSKELHNDFASAPELSAGYIQGVMDMESIEAFVANNNGENAWHVCISSDPKLQTAPLISQLVDRWYLDHPDDAGMTAAMTIIQAVNKECGIEGAHTGVLPKMGLPSSDHEKPKKPGLIMGLPRT